MNASISIPGGFNGPLDSGQGGYGAGVLAGFVDGPAEVTLRRPLPLDAPLDVDRGDDGAARLLQGDELIAEARPVPGFTIDVPAPIGVEEARAASARYRGLPDGMFCRCFVCGRARDDAFGVFAGEVEGRRLVATPWTPADWTADDSGNVRPEFVWAALDCPTYFGLYFDRELPMSFLGRFTARIDRPVAAGDEHVVMAWPIELDGRKHHAGAAVLSSDGTVLAAAHALLIAPREAVSAGR